MVTHADTCTRNRNPITIQIQEKSADFENDDAEIVDMDDENNGEDDAISIPEEDGEEHENSIDDDDPDENEDENDTENEEDNEMRIPEDVDDDNEIVPISQPQDQDNSQSQTSLIPIKCATCEDLEFPTQSIYYDHILNHHDPRTCPVCNLELTTKYKWRYHIKAVHEGVKNHFCQFCEKGT
jgi:hypothetical protein